MLLVIEHQSVQIISGMLIGYDIYMMIGNVIQCYLVFDFGFMKLV